MIHRGDCCNVPASWPFHSGQNQFLYSDLKGIISVFMEMYHDGIYGVLELPFETVHDIAYNRLSEDAKKEWKEFSDYLKK